MRDTFVKSFYDIRWEDAAAASAFDLVIDTGKVPPDLAVTWLVEAVRSLKERKTDDQPTSDTIEINTGLARTVSKVLGCQVTH